MIIWGTKGRETEIGQGTFYCPRCDAQKAYIHKEVSRYFTLFFLPIFKIKKLGEYLQCKACNTTFKPEVLQIEPLSQGQRILINIKGDLASGTPIQMVEKKLINAGMEPDSALKIINEIKPEIVRKCSACNLTYVAAITKCSNCGARLSPPIQVSGGSEDR
jgi:hypothetical protein